jgi:Uma2 family endonuclease
MARVESLPLCEYIVGSYSPDRDYVDGVLLERNWGERDHSRLQTKLTGFFGRLEASLGIYTLVEQRVQVAATRFRVPDVCVLLNPTEKQILTAPPFLVVEILSPEDRMRDMQMRVNDYLRFGVSYIWVVDPKTREGHIYEPSRTTFVQDGVFRTSNPGIWIDIASLL